MNMKWISHLKDNPFFRHSQTQRVFASDLKPDLGQKIRIQGMCKDALDFIAQEQLMDRDLWAKFVEQYRLKSDTNKQEWRGEYWGKMMRGAAFVYSVTHNPALYAVLEETVRDLLTAQDEDGAFSTYAPDVQFTKWDLWSRKYILLGLLCFHNICHDETLRGEIITAAKGHADAILARVGNDSKEKMQIEQTSNTGYGQQVHGTMNSLSVLEPMVLLYRETKEQRYLDFASYLVEIGARACGNIFELAYVDRLAPYQYPYTKAYEMMSCFEGLMEYALTVGSEKWKKAAIQFAYRMMESDITVMGSAGTAHEFLNRASVHQVEPGGKSVGQETCVSVTWMKLCARMLLLTGDPLFADCFEQTLYNAYLGTLNDQRVCKPEKIQAGFLLPGVDPVASFLPFDSYTPLQGGMRGMGIGGSLMFSDGTYYGCCACIGSVGIGIAPHLVVLKSENGFAVQLYESGDYHTKTPSGNPIHFKIKTDYPVGDTVRIQVDPEQEERFALSLRIPSWSVDNSLTVNGELLDVTSGMTVIDRKWHTGDMVELHLDMRVEALRPTSFQKDFLRSRIIWRTCDMVPFVMEETPEHRYHAAFRRGPLILVRDDRLGNSDCERLLLRSVEDVYLPAQTEDVSKLSFRALCCVTVFTEDEQPVRLIDCASAGRTWDSDSSFTVWMKTSEQE
jgi:DUF1680 family protein